MKINADASKIARQLVIANSYLAHYKGSDKAVKMLLNILGFSCISYETEPKFRMFFDNDVPEIMSVLHQAPFDFDSPDDTTVNITKTVSIKKTDDSEIKTIDGVTVSITVPEAASSAGFPFVDISAEIIDSTVDYTECEKISAEFTLLQYVFDELATDLNFKSSIVYSQGSSNTVTVVLTNVPDENLPKNAKETLAKQLQEILPINKIVTSDTIIGFTIGEIE